MSGQVARLCEAYREARAELAFVDANLWLGRPRSPEFADEPGLSALQQRLARYQIRGGVVSHFAALTYSPSWGNRILLEQVEGTELWAGIVLMPEMFEPEDAGRCYLDDCLSRGARLARVFPQSHNFSLRSWCSGALLQALADRQLPLSIWHTEVPWEEIRSLCQAYPDLPVILEGTPLKILYYDRLLYPLLAQCPNLRLELHNLVNYLGIEDITRRFGARRLVFGSFMPIYDPNVAMMQVTHARIGEEDKAAIARENLAALVAGVRVS
jgi:hypothetical protein